MGCHVALLHYEPGMGNDKTATDFMLPIPALIRDVPRCTREPSARRRLPLPGFVRPITRLRRGVSDLTD